MTIKPRDIRDGIRDFWRTNDRIDPYDAFDLPTGASTGSTSLLWKPSSVDPTSPVKYGLAIGDISRSSPSNLWLVPIFFGLDSDGKLDPVQSVSLFFDERGKLDPVTSAALDIESSTNSVKVPVELFVASTTAIPLLAFGLQLAALIEQLRRDEDRSAAKLSLGPIAGLVIRQAIAGARAAFAHTGDGDGMKRTVRAVKEAWELYDARVERWPDAERWPDKSRFAKDFDNNLRFWRPSVLVDEDSWALHEKIDLIDPRGDDDHIVLTAAGRRTRDGSLELESIATAVRITALPQRNFTVQPDKDVSPAEIFGTWANMLRANTISLPRDTRAQIDRIIEKVGFRERGDDLLGWVAAAERAAAA